MIKSSLNYFTNFRLKEIILNFLIISFIFLFDMKFEYFQFRYLILFLIIPCIFFILFHLKDKNYNFLISFLFLILFFLSHIVLNLFIEKNEFSQFILFSIIYLIFIFVISFYFRNYINNNIFFITKSFIIIFLASVFYSLYNFRYDVPYFCGGIPDIFNIIDHNPVPGKYVRLSFKELIFLENSHLGMIAPSVLIYYLYKIISKHTNLFENIIFFLFLFICFIKSSTTLLLGISISLIILIIFNFRILSRSITLSYLLLTILSLSILAFNDECKTRFAPYIPEIETKLNIQNKQNSENDIIKPKLNNISQKIESILNIGGSLSSGVYYHALSIGKQSIFEKPFGWGLNRYEDAFVYFGKINPSDIEILDDFNRKDGTNNFIKILVEFGIFGLIIYFFTFLFLVDKSIPIELKLFYLPFIITQSIRGAGYFNGGFALIVFLIIIHYISLKKIK